jgi:hypothetical protein
MFNLVKIHVHAKQRVLEDGDTSYAKKITDRDVIQGKSLNMKSNVHVDAHQGSG